MFLAGVDIGARNTQAVVVEDGRVTGHATCRSGIDTATEAERAIGRALEATGRSTNERPELVGATGVGKRDICLEGSEVISVASVSSAAVAAHHLAPHVRLVVDLGAEESRVISITPEGEPADFVQNDRCAAGTGAFVEAMAEALELAVAGLDAAGLLAENPISLSTQCVVFAESEVVSLIHRNVDRRDIAAAVFRSIAERTVALVRRVEPKGPICLAGGLALSKCFVKTFGDMVGEDLGLEVTVPSLPQHLGALGAALAAVRAAEKDPASGAQVGPKR
jgi:benzoyl-CoA reductase subunit D